MGAKHAVAPDSKWHVHISAHLHSVGAQARHQNAKLASSARIRSMILRNFRNASTGFLAIAMYAASTHGASHVYVTRTAGRGGRMGHSGGGRPRDGAPAHANCWHRTRQRRRCLKTDDGMLAPATCA
eukprot:scaffold131301_cov32-Tisochrysis_lutea.AAC.7